MTSARSRVLFSVLSLVLLLPLANGGCETSMSHLSDMGGVDAGPRPDATMVRDFGGPVDMPVTCPAGQSICHDVCFNLSTDAHNCGTCDNACMAGAICDIGTCTCRAPTIECGGACVDPTSDSGNCGTCGHACAASDMCAAGMCVAMCSAGEIVCFDHPALPDGGAPDGGTATVPVCANLMTDATNCGHCGTQCAGGGSCVSGHCQCPFPEIPCFGTCEDLDTSIDFCGGCGISCGAGGTCVGGVCTTCGPTRTRCGGLCIDFTSDDRNCGSCGHSCPSGETCVAGMCDCGAPFADCGMGCINTTTDAHNCGGCGNSCGVGGVCSGSTCSCGTGYTMCGTACSDTTRDRHNCGMCGNACATGDVCIGSVCVTAPLYHGWTCPIAGCSTTDYDTTVATALGGTYPYNAGDSNACRAWKLAATVCTTMPAAYTDNNNWQCPASGGFTDPAFGTYCASPSTQYSCSTCPGACNAMCIYNPLSLRNCSGSETAQM